VAWPVAARAALMGAEVPLADPAGPGAGPAAGGLLDHRFDARGLSVLRAVVLAHAVAAGMPENRARDVMLAAHELAANAIRHGAGAGRLQVLAGDGMLRVQVHDAGPASLNGQAGTAGRDGQDIPRGGGDGGWPHRPGHGLWVVRQVADQVRVWRGPGGTVVTAAFALPAAGARPAPGGGAGC
jgi:anti-sigma regulatory factor (Ser/Thr protein kinase)